MTESAYITACGFIDASGWGDHLIQHPWPNGDTACPDRLVWRLFSDSPFDRFGRLDMASQYAVVAAEMCLRLRRDACRNAQTAIVLTTATGCLAADLEFLTSMGAPNEASPTAFSYTLPSAAIAEVAIRHQMKGPSLCLSKPPHLGDLSLSEGLRLVFGQEARQCLCIVVDAIPAHALRYLPTGYRGGLAGPYAYAFLVEGGSPPGPEAASGMAEIRTGVPPLAGGPDAVPGWAKAVGGDLCRFLLAAAPNDQMSIAFPVSSSMREMLIVTKAVPTSPYEAGAKNGPTC